MLIRKSAAKLVKKYQITQRFFRQISVFLFEKHRITMKTHLKYLLFILPFMFGSCKTMQPYYMDILRPGFVVSPIGEQGVLIVDNAGLQPADFGHVFEGIYKTKADTFFDVSYETSSAKTAMLHYLADKLEGEGFYDSVSVAPDEWGIATKRGSMGFLRTDALNDEQRRTLRNLTQLPVWISLDKFMINTETIMKSLGDMYITTRDVVVRTVWRVFDAEADTTMLVFQHNDTLYWDRIGGTASQAAKGMPGFISTLPEIADYVATEVYRIFTPFWEPVDRVYFVTGSYRMNLAYDCVRNDNWDGAASLWQEEYEKGFGRSVYRAAMNMMLYFERAGNPLAALEWCDLAQASFNQSFFRPKNLEIRILNAWKTSLVVRVSEMNRLTLYFNGKLD